MLGTVLTHLVQKAGSLISTVQEYLTRKLLQLLGVLTALKTQFAELNNLLNQFVSAVQKLKALVVLCITQVLSIKAVVTSALVKIWAIGLQLVTTARLTLQLVKQALKKDK